MPPLVHQTFGLTLDRKYWIQNTSLCKISHIEVQLLYANICLDYLRLYYANHEALIRVYLHQTNYKTLHPGYPTGPCTGEASQHTWFDDSYVYSWLRLKCTTITVVFANYHYGWHKKENFLLRYLGFIFWFFITVQNKFWYS